MLPEVEAYFEATKAAREQKLADEKKLEEDYYTIEQRHIEARNAAWETLKKNSGDPFLTWLCTNPRMRNRREYAEEVFKILPTDTHQLDRLANRHDWCSDYDDLRAMAIQAGVIAVDLRLQTRTPGDDWRPFRPIHYNGLSFTAKEVRDLFAKGASRVQIEMINGEVFFLRLDPNSRSILRDRNA